MKRLSHALLAAATITAVVAAGAPASLVAQTPGAMPATTRSLVTVSRLNPDMVTEWFDLQKNEVVPALKKAGVTSRTVLATQVGNAYEYATLTPFPSWAAMDGDAPLVRALGAEAAARLNAKIRKCILTQQSYMTNRVDDLNMYAGDALVWRIAVRRAMPGKMTEYLAFYKADILPAMQKAKADGKIAGATVAVRGAGAQSGEFTTVTYYSKFADMDAGDPMVLTLGQDAVDKIGAKGALLSTAVQVIVRRRVAELSF